MAATDEPTRRLWGHMDHLTRWDALLLFNYWLDTAGDFMFQGMFVLFLSENLGASDWTAATIKATMIIFEAVINFFFGNVLDRWPRDAPLLALTYLKPIGAVSTLLLIIIDLVGELTGLSPTAKLVCTLMVCICVFAPSEALGTQAFDLEVDRRCELPENKPLRQIMLTWSYGIMNGGALCAFITIASYRSWAGADALPLANRLVLGTSATLYIICAIVAKVAHGQLVQHGLVVPHTAERPWITTIPNSEVDDTKSVSLEPIRVHGGVPYTMGELKEGNVPLDEDSEEDERPPGYFSVYEHPDDRHDPCAWDCSAESCSRMSSVFKSKRMRGYMLVIASCIGISWLFAQLDDTLPKYMIRRFNEPTLYALFQTINPAIVMVMGALIPLVPGVTLVPVIDRLMLGMSIQALGALWATLVHQEWAMAVMLVQCSLGEAMSQPLLKEFAFGKANRGEKALYLSSATGPRVIARVAGLAFSGFVLSTFCPDATVCTGTTAPYAIWGITTAVALITPITQLILKKTGCVH